MSNAALDFSEGGGQAGENANLASFLTSSGQELQGMVLRLTRQLIAFEVYGQTILHVSEVLGDFKIQHHHRPIFSGKATLTSVVHTGAILVCEAMLDDGWLDVDLFNLQKPNQVIAAGFQEFLARWERFQKIVPEYKLVVSDMQSFLLELRQWLEQMELAVRSLPTGDRNRFERELVSELMQAATPAVS
ncbi:MAG TPA: hypothetical protein VGE41_06760, partial [Verrucomicrobiae bacterium]